MVLGSIFVFFRFNSELLKHSDDHFLTVCGKFHFFLLLRLISLPFLFLFFVFLNLPLDIVFIYSDKLGLIVGVRYRFKLACGVFVEVCIDFRLHLD